MVEKEKFTAEKHKRGELNIPPSETFKLNLSLFYDCCHRINILMFVLHVYLRNSSKEWSTQSELLYFTTRKLLSAAAMSETKTNWNRFSFTEGFMTAASWQWHWDNTVYLPEASNISCSTSWVFFSVFSVSIWFLEKKMVRVVVRAGKFELRLILSLKFKNDFPQISIFYGKATTFAKFSKQYKVSKPCKVLETIPATNA